VVNAHFPLLPTPTTRMQDDTPSQRKRNSPGLGIVGVHFNDGTWGKYGSAVHQWAEVQGVPAPAPTFINEKGERRLNVAFAEWMMGLPDGWVTDVPGLSRAQQIKAIGNGVVPAQAGAAIKELMERG